MLMIALRVEAVLIIESLPLMTHRLSPAFSLSLSHPAAVVTVYIFAAALGTGSLSGFFSP